MQRRKCGGMRETEFRMRERALKIPSATSIVDYLSGHFPYSGQEEHSLVFF